MAFNDARLAKRAAVDKIAGSQCLQCRDFLEHVGQLVSKKLIEVRNVS